MKIVGLATDFDGTIADEGRVDGRTAAALGRARTQGLMLVPATGRQLADLADTFADVGLFHRIVGENGAVLFDPSAKVTRILAPAPPPALLDRLAAAGVPLSVGHSIVATVEPFEQEMRSAINELELNWHVVLNKGSVMALPAGVTKASGVVRALEELGVAPGQTMGVGDAENDQDLLRICGFAVAVANALTSLKQQADLVTVAEGGAGVVELLERWQRGDFERLPERTAASRVTA
jgi:hydroxymethylpyrimidine pyrophosphatase-like HAD family hydrolase